MRGLKLAEAGMPAETAAGFELLDQEQGIGTSQFMETARFRRSLEGELARTISSITSVKGARVHLAIPERSVFLRDQRKPSASVLLEVLAGRSVAESQVRAIGNLVASSVPDLQLAEVTIVDQKGNLLSNFARTRTPSPPTSSSNTPPSWRCNSWSASSACSIRCSAAVATRRR